VGSSIGEVLAALDELVAGHRLIGIAGAPGAGKSTIAAALAGRLHGVVLPMDGFHLPQSRLVELGRRERMGAPDTFDVDGFVRVLADLHIGDGTVFAPGFDRDREEPVRDAIAIQPEVRHVIVEGNYLLLERDGWERVAPLLDVTVFIELPRGIRQQRLIERHMRFGRSPEEATAWALGTDERNALLIEATAARADHVLRVD
jgi:pantothenate kinase